MQEYHPQTIPSRSEGPPTPEQEYPNLAKAAPDLLVVCLTLVHDRDIAQGYAGLDDYIWKLREMAQKAIAKAEGKVPCES